LTRRKTAQRSFDIDKLRMLVELLFVHFDTSKLAAIQRNSRKPKSFVRTCHRIAFNSLARLLLVAFVSRKKRWLQWQFCHR